MSSRSNPSAPPTLLSGKARKQSRFLAIFGLIASGAQSTCQKVRLLCAPRHRTETDSSAKRLQQAGFTIIELTVVIVLTGIIGTGMYAFFNTSFSQYLGLQQDSSTYNDLAYQSQRVASVVRTATDITAASPNDATMYAYFWPNDAYVSQIRYHLSNGNNQLLAEVTPMTANPPLGTPITGSLKTYTVISNYFYQPTVSLFNYLDSAGADLGVPIADLYTIKGVRINLAVPTRTSVPTTNNSTISVQVTLRNRKTNL